MAACGSLQHIFENPLPENPTLLETLSWNQIKPVKSNLEQSSFTEIFGELHFKETSLLPIPSSLEPRPNIETYIEKKNYASSEKSEEKNTHPSVDYSFLSTPQGAKYTRCHKSSESLQLCTEGLGFESCDEVEDMKNETKEENCRQEEEEEKREKKQFSCQNLGSDFVKSSRSNNGQSRFPPPISSLSENGKPFVCLKSYREDGRFVLKEIRIPTREFLHACREDGRLKLHFVHPKDEIPEEDEEEDDYDEEEEEEEEEEDCGANDEEICRSND